MPGSPYPAFFMGYQNGSGTNPVSFNGGFKLNLTSEATLRTRGIAGVQSALWVRNGATLNFSSFFTGLLHVEANATIRINTDEINFDL